MVRINRIKAEKYRVLLDNLEYPESIIEFDELDEFITEVFNFDAAVVGSLTSCFVEEEDLRRLESAYKYVKKIDYYNLCNKYPNKKNILKKAIAYFIELEKAYFLLAEYKKVLYNRTDK